MVKYCAYFEGRGYYAKHQPHYEWSFTEHVEDALEYKTLEGCMERLFFTTKYSNAIVVVKDSKVVDDVVTIQLIKYTEEETRDAYEKYQQEKFSKKYAKHNKSLKLSKEDSDFVKNYDEKQQSLKADSDDEWWVV
jgi:hypothetical protein